MRATGAAAVILALTATSGSRLCGPPQEADPRRPYCVEFLALSGAQKESANAMIRGILIGASHERLKANQTPIADISAEAMVARVEQYCADHRDQPMREGAEHLLDQLVAEYTPAKSPWTDRQKSKGDTFSSR